MQDCPPAGACSDRYTYNINTPQSSIWQEHTALLLVPSQLDPQHVGKLLTLLFSDSSLQVL